MQRRLSQATCSLISFYWYKGGSRKLHFQSFGHSVPTSCDLCAYHNQLEEKKKLLLQEANEGIIFASLPPKPKEDVLAELTMRQEIYFTS